MTTERLAQLRATTKDYGLLAESLALECLDAIESLQAEVAGMRKAVEPLAQLPFVESDDETCQICGDPFELRDGTVSTGVCDLCAQTILADMTSRLRTLNAARKEKP